MWRWSGLRWQLYFLMFSWVAEGRGRVSARRPKSFSLLRQRKGLKRKATLLAATPSLRCGATWVGALAGWAAELTSLLRSFVRTTAASQITKRLHPAVQPPPRQHPDPGASRREWGTTRAIAALGLGGQVCKWAAGAALAIQRKQITSKKIAAGAGCTSASAAYQ